MFINPYQNIPENSRYLRANFHTHAGTGRNTCGHYSKKVVLKNYSKLNYDIICISNHNRFTNPNKVRKTFGILLVPGYEYSSDPHVVCVGTTKVVRGNKRQQAAIDSTLAEGGVAIMAHPNWKVDYYLSKEDIEALKGYSGIEILNGSIDCGMTTYANKDNRGDAADVFDYILSKGLLKWCYANDDFHRWNHLGRCWNMIFCEKNTESMLSALKKGAFYASSGIVLEKMLLHNGILTVSARGGECYKMPFEYKFIGKDGEVLYICNGLEANYAIRGNEAYIRVEITAPIGCKLYTQPVYNTEFFSNN